MAKKDLAFHIVAADGADTFGFSTKKTAEDAREEMREKMGVWASSVIRMIPGTEHWVVHVRWKNGRMQSFGFDSQVEAMKFQKEVRTTGEAELVSMPTKAELRP